MGREGVAESVVLDAGALIAFARGDRATRSTVRACRERGGTIVIPAGVLGQVWRDGARQARLAGLIEASNTDIEVLDEPTAKAVGVICGRSGTSDIVDASVVLSARLHAAVVLTSDAADLRLIDPAIAVEEV